MPEVDDNLIRSSARIDIVLLYVGQDDERPMVPGRIVGVMGADLDARVAREAVDLQQVVRVAG